MASLYRDDLTAALARAEAAEREVDRLEDELDSQRSEMESWRASTVGASDQAMVRGSPTVSSGGEVTQDERKELTKLRRRLERTRTKLDKLRARREKWTRVNAALMLIAGLLGAALELVLRR